MTTGSPERARADVLAEHARLRARLDQLVAQALPTARKVGHAALRGLLTELRSAIQDHVQLEERELVPLLQTVDAWGPVRVAKLRDRHDAILRAIDGFAADLAPERHGPCDVLERLQSVVEPLLRDMEDEEIAIRAFEETSLPVSNQTSG